MRRQVRSFRVAQMLWLHAPTHSRLAYRQHVVLCLSQFMKSSDAMMETNMPFACWG